MRHYPGQKFKAIHFLFNYIKLLLGIFIANLLISMKVELELVQPDEGSSFRFLYQFVPSHEFVWQYHYHPEFELVCVTGGSGTRHVGSHLSSYDNGDLVLIGSNVPHSGFGLNASDPHEEIVLQAKEDIILRAGQQLPEIEAIETLLDKARYGILFTGKIKEEVTAFLLDLRQQSSFEKYIGLLKVLQLLAHSGEYQLLNRQVILPDTINKHKARLQKILTYVEQHYAEETNIEKVAQLAGLSIPSFCNYFKKTTHITFTEFVNRYRIQKACLLLQQDKTISEACYECGFNNVTYFNKVFKTVMGKTPSEFRRV